MDASTPIRDERVIADVAEAIDTLIGFLSHLANERRRVSQDDLTSGMATVADKREVGDEQAIDVLHGRWTVGFQTTDASIDAAVIRMLQTSPLSAATVVHLWPCVAS